MMFVERSDPVVDCGVSGSLRYCPAVCGCTDFVLYPEVDGKPAEGTEDGCDVVKLMRPSHDQSVLNVLKLLKASARGPDEKRITIVQPGGDKGVEQLLRERRSLANVSQMKVSCFGEELDACVSCEVGEDGVVRERDAGYNKEQSRRVPCSWREVCITIWCLFSF